MPGTVMHNDTSIRTAGYSDIGGAYFVPGDTSAPGSSGLNDLLELASIPKFIQLGYGYHNITKTSSVDLDGVTIIGASGGAVTTDRTIIYVNTGANPFYFDMDNGAKIENITFDGPGAGVSGQTRVIRADYQAVIRNCTFNTYLTSGSSTQWIETVAGGENLIEGCSFVADTGEWPDRCIRLDGDNCTVRRCRFGSASSDVESTAVILTGNSSTEHIIDGNWAWVDQTGCTVILMDSVNRGHSVINNKVTIETATSAATSRFLTMNSATGTNGRHIIKGNHIIALQSGDYHSLSLMTINAPGCIVSENIITASYYSYDAYSDDTVLILISSSGEGSMILNNVIDGDKCSAITIRAPKCLIAGNILTNCAIHEATSGKRGAIRIGTGTDDVTYTRVTGNYVEFTNDDGTTTGDVYSIYTNVTSDDDIMWSVISNNVGTASESGSGTAYFINSDDMENCVFAGNAWSGTVSNCFDGNGTTNIFGSSGSTESGCNIDGLSPP